jgi:hypothetical protein
MTDAVGGGSGLLIEIVPRRGRREVMTRAKDLGYSRLKSALRRRKSPKFLIGLSPSLALA